MVWSATTASSPTFWTLNTSRYPCSFSLVPLSVARDYCRAYAIRLVSRCPRGCVDWVVALSGSSLTSIFSAIWFQPICDTMPAGNPSNQPPSSAHFVESVTDLHQIESQGMTHSSTPHHSQGGRFPPSHVRMSNNPSTLDPMHANPLPFLSPQPYVGYSADPQPLLDPRTVPLNSYNNPNSSSTQVAPWFATPQSHSDASGSSLSPSVNYFPEDTHGSASPASDGAPSNTSFDSSRQDVNGPADPSAGFSFIALPNADPPRKRPRRKYE